METAFADGAATGIAHDQRGKETTFQGRLIG